MTEQEEGAAVVPELLPPGVYPVWSPYGAYEAADALMKALAADCMEQDPPGRARTDECMNSLAAVGPVQGTEEG